MSALISNRASGKKTGSMKTATVSGTAVAEERTGPLFYVLVVATALLIMALIFGGTFFFIVRKNINGIGEQLRKDLQDVPLLKLALPKPPDPYDEKYMSESEVRKRYTQLRQELTSLQQELENANQKIGELEKNLEEAQSVKSEGEKALKEAEDKMNSLQQQEKMLEEERRKLYEIAAKSDREGFRKYYENLYGETAEKIYREIVKEEAVSKEVQQFVKLYEAMDASAAARIFEQLGKDRLQLVVDILTNMKRETASEILASMNASLAAEITNKLAQQYLPGE